MKIHFENHLVFLIETTTETSIVKLQVLTRLNYKHIFLLQSVYEGEI